MQRPSVAVAAAVASLVFAGCGSSQAPIKGPGGEGAGKSKKGAVSIEKAELPYKILRARGGTEVDKATFMAELGAASAVCLGENHKNPHHHWAQLHLFDALSKSNEGSGRETALGMEMFQRPFQGVLDDYAAGKIDEDAMLSRSGYADRWGFDWGFYGPTVAMAAGRNAKLLALNTERELTKRVARVGLKKLTATERAKLPELNLENETHRAWWDAIMGGMSHPAPEGDKPADPHAEPKAEPDDPHAAPKKPGGHGHDHAKPKPADMDQPQGRPDNRAEWIYTAQVLWDETMADGAHKWLQGGDKRQVVILAGNGHCHDSGIVARLKRRGVADTVSVRPIIDKGDGEVAASLATPENDYLLVMTLPK